MADEVVTAVGSLPNGWQVQRLRTLTTHIGSGATPRGGAAIYLDERVNFAIVRSQNVFDRFFNEEGLAYISDADAASLQGVELQEDDVLLNITGDGITFARSCLAPHRILPACVNQHVVRIRCDKSKCEPGYLLSFLTHPLAKEYIESFNAGGSRRAITKRHIESFEIPLPPLREQQAIACILGALDDKIELNRRRNRTLEAMARAIFQSWFVDFDPVKAKAASRTPSGLAAHFPDSFIDSPLGPIPNGWRVGSILEIADLLSGGTPKTSEPSYWDGQIPWASAKDVSQCGEAFLIDTERTITEVGLENSATQVIPALSSVVVARGATTGRLTMFGDDIAMNQTCYALRCKLKTPRFLYLLLRHEIDAIVRTAHGSVFDTITTATFRASKVCIPASQLIEALEKRIAPMFDQLLGTLRQSRTLAALRDALLPKLISGELRVPDAERIVGRVV